MESHGHLILEDGVIKAIHDERGEIGRFYVGTQSLVYEGELTLFQENDPPKLRFASRYPANTRGALGVLSFNYMRPDDIQEEVAFVKGALAEDSTGLDDLRGQFEYRVRRLHGGEPELVQVATSAYSAELTGRPGDLYIASLRPIPNLFKF